jgi:hypothetical protein
MKQLLTEASLESENLAYSGTPGISRENRDCGFSPAFLDTETGRIVESCFQDGQPAPLHVIEGLPDDWIVERDPSSRATAIKCTVIAGFVRNSRFYTRSQAAEAVLSETTTQDLHTTHATDT